MARRSRTNLLALAVLCTLAERPMHPYEVAQTLRTRAKHASIKLNYGSLYNVVDALERDGLIEARETVRAGRRPERTIYAIAPAGMREMSDWLSDLLGTPVREYPAFVAALSFIAALPPDEAVALLRERAGTIAVQLRELDGVLGADLGIPRLFAIEEEFRAALLRTELDFVHRLVEEIEQGTLDGIDLWRGLFAGEGGEPAT